MKLVVVLMLSALALSCYAGSGCQRLEEVIYDATDPSVTKAEFTKSLEEFIPGDTTEHLLGELKQCFLDQSNRTLSNMKVMMDAIFDSRQCASY
ncbi:mammaglobin-A-like [Myotis daubentonii]|uniref:mammaglobin-A-like n=1 Tax=Myotis daubentonii TaxID=98922 RepID=UPI0028733524|nr:mammaglobin-A-like [Myotis daubentonii]XP_059567231.1 mammaglobin-A-like [Myotis daubentonii]